MRFCPFDLDSQSQKLCIISAPFDLFKYKRLPMSINNSPFFWSVMLTLFACLHHIECFIDDIGIFSNSSFSDHLHDLHQVLLLLTRNGVTVNPLKYEWDTQSTEYLGFLLIPQSIKPMPYKISSTTNLAYPT